MPTVPATVGPHPNPAPRAPAAPLVPASPAEIG